MAKRQRNYQQEYKRRIERGLAKGQTRAEARGHKPAKTILSTASRPPNRNDPLEKALFAMRKEGLSLTAAAKAEKVSRERLRSYIAQNVDAKYEGRKWVIVDKRPKSVRVLAIGGTKIATLSAEDASRVSAHLNAVQKFKRTRDAKHLEPFKGAALVDRATGERLRLETRPNVLLRLFAMEERSFVEIYADTAAEGGLRG